MLASQEASAAGQQRERVLGHAVMLLHCCHAALQLTCVCSHVIWSWHHHGLMQATATVTRRARTLA
jgi:hypothetical protein